MILPCLRLLSWRPISGFCLLCNIGWEILNDCAKISKEQTPIRRMQAHQSKRKSHAPYLIALLLVGGLGTTALVHSVSNWTARAKARKLQNPIPPTKENIGMGMMVYTDHCQRCHGEKGDGKGEKASQLSVAPGNFTDMHKMKDLTDGELYWQVTSGRDPMPGFQDKLSVEERWQVVDYVRDFLPKPTAASVPKAETPKQK
jgi:mono/diheme cytochrome c family protein